MRIGVDIMGGDFYPQAPVEGAVLARERLGDHLQLVLIGDRELIHGELQRLEADPTHFEIVHTDSFVEMDESPTKAIAGKPRSSMNLGLGMVKAGQLDGFVSAGNTGAMLVGSIMGLGKIEGVSRPTIGVLFPNHEGKLSLLCDVGANVDCKAETLLQFGILGSLFMESVWKTPRPRVGLLNIGEEDSKGPQVVRQAHELMSASSHIHFVGNVEGRGIYTGAADVIVTDGYTGNIVLKFAESLYDVFAQRFPEDEAIQTFNFENYGGVPILGIKGISIIGHGISTGNAIAQMIRNAATAAESGLVPKIEAAFQSIQSQNNA